MIQQPFISSVHLALGFDTIILPHSHLRSLYHQYHHSSEHIISLSTFWDLLGLVRFIDGYTSRDHASQEDSFGLVHGLFATLTGGRAIHEMMRYPPLME